jgi:hypothetical protein
MAAKARCVEIWAKRPGRHSGGIGRASVENGSLQEREPTFVRLLLSQYLKIVSEGLSKAAAN